MFRRPRIAAALTLGLLGLGLFGQGIYMCGKAVIAQHLLNSAWMKTAATGNVHLPWPWMDAHPVARLTLGSQKRSYIVLNTDSGQALAFGPAIVSGTENTEALAIAAHKNTQFQGLKNLQYGDKITLERPTGETLTYQVSKAKVLDSRIEGLKIGPAAHTPSSLTLVTCYPFDTISFNGPLRYVVFTERVEP
jgi:sortase A